MALHFQRLTETDLPTLTEWLQRPHVAEWWEVCTSVEETRAKYLPHMDESSTVVPYFANLDCLPIRGTCVFEREASVY